jgi:hypothetical protein
MEEGVVARSSFVLFRGADARCEDAFGLFPHFYARRFLNPPIPFHQ